MSKALVLGGNGLLGSALMQELVRKGWEAVSIERAAFNIFSPAVIEGLLAKHNPDMLFNTVAWTQVDLAEDKPSEAMQVNRAFPALLARLVHKSSTHLVHLSTDFVFNGRSARPYEVDDSPDPQSVYGATKLAGEQAVLEGSPDNSCVVRTAWLFGPGRKNFVQTILAASQTRSELTVVHDQVGSPTYTPDLAKGCIALADKKCTGIFHVVNAGVASWCELAAEAISLAGLQCAIKPIRSADWPQKACRPRYSVLSTTAFTAATGISPRPWPQALRDYIYTDLAVHEDSAE